MHSTDDRSVLRVGFWASLVALAGAMGYVASAVLQVFGVLDDVQDSVLAYGASVLMPVPFLLALLALHFLRRLAASRSSLDEDDARVAGGDDAEGESAAASLVTR